MRRKDYPFMTTVFRDSRQQPRIRPADFPTVSRSPGKTTPPPRRYCTYPEARDDVRAIGSSLIARGFSEAHVALLGEPSYEWICSYFAHGIGSVVVPLDPNSPPDLADLVNHADCTYVMLETMSPRSRFRTLGAPANSRVDLYRQSRPFYNRCPRRRRGLYGRKRRR